MSLVLPPPLTAPEDAGAALRAHGFAVLSAAGLGSLTGAAPDALAALAPCWDDLPPDPHLKDGGRYRRRRHASLVVAADGALTFAPHRAHWQPLEYNALHGGLRRWFEPLAPAMAEAPAFLALVRGVAGLASALRGARPWYVEAHPFRIDTTDGIGRPTPEGAHRDGVDLVAVVLVARAGIKGGETRVFEAAGPAGQRFTLAEPWSALLLDDARVVHESTPILPAEPGGHGHRDTLVLTYRADGFQGG